MSKVQSKSKKPVEIEEDSSEEEVVVPKKQVKTTQGAAKAKAPAKKVVESSDEESEEEVIKPAAKGKTAQKATTKAAAKKVESDSEESELEDVAPKGKKAAPTKPAAKVTPKATPQIDDSVSDESEEAPKPKAKAAPAKAPAKKAPVVESSEEESEEEVKPKKAAAPVKKAPAKKVESEEESDEESTPKVAPKKTAAPVKAAAKKVVESSEEESEEEVKPKKAAPAKKAVKEESEEESEEEVKPAAKTQSNVPAVADDGNYEVIVKGLPFAAADHDVKEYFQEAGEISNVNLLKGPDGRSKGIAFVRYADNEGLSKALTYSGMDFGGRQIVVEKTTPKGQRNDNAGGRGGFGAQGRGGQLASSGDFGPKSERDPNSCSIFVGNLSWGADENSLAAFFESCGTVQNVRVARDPEGKARGFGHVDFTSPDAVTAAVALAGGNLEGRPVRVDYATGKKNQDGGARGFGGGSRGGFGGSGFGGGRGGAPGGGRMNLSEEDAGRKKGSISSFQGQKQRL